MRRRFPIAAWVTIAGAAFLGLLLGHWIDYKLVFPEHVARHAALASSGHDYLATALVMAIAAFVVAGVGCVLLGFRIEKGALHGDFCFGATMFRLSVSQVSGFVLLEVSERFFTGSSFQGIAKLLVLGVAAQLIAACAGAVVLVLLTLVGKLMARVRPRRWRLKRLTVRPVLGTRLIVRLSSFATTIRGPPAPGMKP